MTSDWSHCFISIGQSVLIWESQQLFSIFTQQGIAQFSNEYKGAAIETPMSVINNADMIFLTMRDILLHKKYKFQLFFLIPQFLPCQRSAGGSQKSKTADRRLVWR